jgi:hypothetical protein
VVTLVNLSPFAARRVILQAGGFGEHRFTTVSYDQRTSDYPGSQHRYAAPTVTTEIVTATVEATTLQVEMPPATTIRLVLGMMRFVNDPTYALPWG